jgi:hypothetical protein
MTIANVSELNGALSKLGLYGSAAQPGSTGSLSANSSGLLPSSSSQGGSLASTIMQALSQIGVSGTQSALGAAATNGSPGSSGSSGSSTGSTQNSSQALKSFMQSLFAALQAQAAASASQHGASAASSGTSNSGGHGHGRGHRHGGGGGLQSLIQQLSASSSTSSSATSSATSTAASAQLSSLQQSFNSLVSTVGGSGSQASLSNFLTTLASDLSPAAHTGNLVSTQA